MEYFIAITVFFLLCICWGVFQIWIGKQPDGTGLHDDERSCSDCGDERQVR